MNKQFIVSVIVLFVWTMLLGFIIHGMILGPEYAALPGVFRPEAEAQNYFGYVIAGHVSMAIGLTWVYRMGCQGKPWVQQGLKFGIAVVLLMTTSIYLIYYAVQQMPAELVTKQVMLDTPAVILTGLITAFLNK